MNPFDLPGPEFLGFYAIFCILILIFSRKWAVRHEPQGSGVKLEADDPYEIATLIHEEDEAITIAVFSLVDRGLVVFDKFQFKARDETAVTLVRRPIEVAVLNACGSEGASLKGIQSDLKVREAARAYRRSLEARGLFANLQQRLARTRVHGCAQLLIWSVAFLKMGIALSRGRTNIWFLVVAVVSFSYFLNSRFSHDRTPAGESTKDDLETLFSGLLSRSQQIPAGGATNEATLLAAVFGMSAVLLPQFPFVSYFMPRSTVGPSTGSSDWDSSCSSSCGSSSFSCGSSCGGGGGCGGCGGGD